MATAPPTGAPTSRAIAAADATPALPLAGPPSAEGSVQTLAVAPTTPVAQAANAANTADAGAPSDTQSLFFVVMVVLLGLPALLLMTLLATVLTRR
jgi:hypothetical protein